MRDAHQQSAMQSKISDESLLWYSADRNGQECNDQIIVASTPGPLTFDIEIGGPGLRRHVTLRHTIDRL